MRFLLTLSIILIAATARGESIRLLVQSSPLAGSQYYSLAKLAPTIQVGDRLALVREPENRHDPYAIRVEWRGQMLGYLPRAENRAVAAAMDGGQRVVGRVARLREDGDPWHRLQIDVFAEL